MLKSLFGVTKFVTFCALAALSSTFALAQHYNTNLLVISPPPPNVAVPAGVQVDPNLQNPWGLSAGYNPGNPPGAAHWWVSDEHNGFSSLYDGFGNIINPPFVILPSACSPAGSKGKPTGQVFNGSANDFQVASGFAAAFIFATFDGTISAWNKVVDGGTAEIEVDNCPTHASYTGITIVVVGGKKFLVATNFNSGHFDTFDSNFRPCNQAAANCPFQVGVFEDATLVADANTTVVPFNIQAIGNNVYVTYAEKNASGQLVIGKNTGFVNVFSADGKTLVRRLGKIFNAPWGVAQSGVFFGAFSHAVLIGNHGDGTILAIDPATGQSQGNLLNPNGAVLQIPGLFGLQFGNDSFVVGQPGSGPAINLYFTANTVNGLLDSPLAINGQFGNLTPVGAELAGADVY